MCYVDLAAHEKDTGTMCRYVTEEMRETERVRRGKHSGKRLIGIPGDCGISSENTLTMHHVDKSVILSLLRYLSHHSLVFRDPVVCWDQKDLRDLQDPL